MSNTLTDALAAQWPSILPHVGETATYYQGETSTEFGCIVQGRNDEGVLDVNWEAVTRQIEVHVAASDMPATINEREDTVEVNGLTFTVLGYSLDNGIYRLACERTETDSIREYGRRY